MQVLNSFSPNMLGSFPATVSFKEISVEHVRQELAGGVESSVGHSDTAAVYTDVLGIQVPAVRSTISLQPGDTAIIGQYRGPRLPEGARTLPEGATIQWLCLKVE